MEETEARLTLWQRLLYQQVKHPGCVAQRHLGWMRKNTDLALVAELYEADPLILVTTWMEKNSSEATRLIAEKKRQERLRRI